jgi:hypothetical protein
MNLEQLDLDDVVDARNQIILSAIISGAADTLRLSVPEELAEYLDGLEQDLANRPSQTPGAAHNEVIAAMQRLARSRHEMRVRHVQAEIQSARSSGDNELLLLSLQRMNQLASHKSRFDPRQSPYFKDTRTEAG